MRAIRDKAINIRLTANEQKILKYHADKLNISTSEFIRREVLNGLITTK